METSILAKLPREIRDQIYAAVFENARIAIKVRPPRPDGKTPGGPRDTVLYHYGRDCGLSVTCRAIMTETEEIMWRSAVCEVFGSFSYENEEENAVCSVWLHHLRKVLPHKYAQNIAHLRNVWAPTVNNVGDWHIESFTESLRGFPQLRTCGFAFRLQGEPEHYIPILPATTVDRRSHHLFTRHHKRIVTKQLLPFTTGNVNGLSQSSLCPKTFLWEAICSTPEMNVQMIMQRAYQSSRDPLSYKVHGAPRLNTQPIC